MSRKRISETRHFLALQACWTILRGGSVAWKINLTGGGFDALTASTFMAECQMDGRPVTLRDLMWADPDLQPD